MSKNSQRPFKKGDIVRLYSGHAHVRIEEVSPCNGFVRGYYMVSGRDCDWRTEKDFVLIKRVSFEGVRITEMSQNGKTVNCRCEDNYPYPNRSLYEKFLVNDFLESPYDLEVQFCIGRKRLKDVRTEMFKAYLAWSEDGYPTRKDLDKKGVRV